jgi:hypothetical protein
LQPIVDRVHDHISNLAARRPAGINDPPERAGARG